MRRILGYSKIFSNPDFFDYRDFFRRSDALGGTGLAAEKGSPLHLMRGAAMGLKSLGRGTLYMGLFCGGTMILQVGSHLIKGPP